LYQNCSLILKFHLLIQGPTNKISTKNQQSKSVYKTLASYSTQIQTGKSLIRLGFLPSTISRELFDRAKSRIIRECRKRRIRLLPVCICRQESFKKGLQKSPVITERVFFWLQKSPVITERVCVCVCVCVCERLFFWLQKSSISLKRVFYDLNKSWLIEIYHHITAKEPYITEKSLLWSQQVITHWDISSYNCKRALYHWKESFYDLNKSWLIEIYHHITAKEPYINE